VTGTNDAPVLSASLMSHTYVDTNQDNTFNVLNGQLSTSDPDAGDSATYAVAGGTSDDSLSGFDRSLTGTYGKLYLNSSTGAYRFVPNDAAIEALKSNASDSFTLTVTDGSGVSDTETLAVNVTGVNDTPVLTATLTAHTYADTSGDDTFAAINGQLSTTDRDSGDSVEYRIIGSPIVDNSVPGFDHSLTNAYGTLYLSSSTGAYRFLANDAAIEALKTTTSTTFTLVVFDGSSGTDTETLTINLNGTNDTPTFGGQSTGSVQEDTTTSVSGTLTVADRDAGESVFQAQSGLAGTYGTLNINAAGQWTYFLNNGNAAVQALNTGQSLADAVTVRSADGTTKQINVTINGLSDNSVDFDTKSVEYSWLFSPNGSRYFAQTETVGSQVEFTTSETWGSFGQMWSVDIQGDIITIDYAGSIGWLNATFNGFFLNDVSNNLPNFHGIEIISNNTALGSSRINVTGNEISVNWAGLSFNSNSLIQFRILTNNPQNDPIVLDLGGDGFSFDAQVSFDLDNDGTAETISWMAPGDGLLVMDLDSSGMIENGREVLSEAFLGLGFGSSMEALRSLDTNLDGLFDANDDAYSMMLVWTDSNGNGVSDEGELHSLAELDIISFSLSVDALPQEIDGQEVYARGMFTYGNGDANAYAAVRFGLIEAAPIYAVDPLDPSVQSGTGTSPDLIFVG
jgi:VCBS repeat-containing protein